MKIVPKYNIGDLIMCKVAINPYDDERENNLRSVIGWITDVKTYYESKLIAYSVQWSDKDGTVLLSEDDMHRFREFYEQARNS